MAVSIQGVEVPAFMKEHLASYFFWKGSAIRGQSKSGSSPADTGVTVRSLKDAAAEGIVDLETIWFDEEGNVRAVDGLPAYPP